MITLITNNNNDIIDFNDKFKLLFNSFQEIIDFSIFFKNEISKNNNIIIYKNYKFYLTKKYINKNKTLYSLKEIFL